MGFWKYSYILALLSLEVTLTQGFHPSVVTQGSAPTCQLFQASFLAVIEATLDAPDAFIHPDHDLTFFREVMKFRDAQIQHTIDDAFKFFNDSFGLDFSVSPPNEYNQYFYENAVMGPFRFVNVEYLVILSNWIQTGVPRSNCYLIRDGGFMVTFTAAQTLYGTYGGDPGIEVATAESLYYGYYNIDVCQQSPIIIQFQSGSPIRQVPVDGINVINGDLYSQVLGYGKAEGVFSVKPSPDEPGKFHASARSVFTFPA